MGGVWGLGWMGEVGGGRGGCEEGVWWWEVCVCVCGGGGVGWGE